MSNYEYPENGTIKDIKVAVGVRLAHRDGRGIMRDHRCWRYDVEDRIAPEDDHPAILCIWSEEEEGFIVPNHSFVPECLVGTVTVSAKWDDEYCEWLFSEDKLTEAIEQAIYAKGYTHDPIDPPPHTLRDMPNAESNIKAELRNLDPQSDYYLAVTDSGPELGGNPYKWEDAIIHARYIFNAGDFTIEFKRWFRKDMTCDQYIADPDSHIKVADEIHKFFSSERESAYRMSSKQ